MATRGPQRYGSITYPLLAEWTGLAVQTLRCLVRDRAFDPRDIDQTIQWVNGRRLAAGLPLIGMPAEDSAENLSDTRENGTTPANPYISRLESPGYDPQTGEICE